MILFLQENPILFGANVKKGYICRLFVNIYKKLELLYDEKNRVLRVGRHFLVFGQLF